MASHHYIAAASAVAVLGVQMGRSHRVISLLEKLVPVETMAVGPVARQVPVLPERLEQAAQSALSGPVTLVLSHQLAQAISN